MAARNAIQHDDGDAHHQAEQREDHDGAARLALDAARLGLDALQRLADVPERRVAARCDYAREAMSGRQQRTGIDERQIVTARTRQGRSGIARALAHRNGFARQQRLVGRQMRRGLEPCVRRHAIAFLHAQQIACNYVAAGNHAPLAVAQNLRARARQLAQRLERALGPALLIERDRDHHEHREQERQRFLDVAERDVDHTRTDQQQEHRLAHDFPRDRPGAARFRRRQLVGSVACEARRRFDAGQAPGARARDRHGRGGVRRGLLQSLREACRFADPGPAAVRRGKAPRCRAPDARDTHAAPSPPRPTPPCARQDPRCRA